MKKYLWAALSLLFFASGLMTFFFIATKGHVEGALSDKGTPIILDIGGAFLMIGMGILGLKASSTLRATSPNRIWQYKR